MKKNIVLLLVIVMAISMFSACGAPAKEETATEETATKVAVNEQVDLSKVMGSDGQPLFAEAEPKEIPERPEDPDALPETDPLHWWDMEYAGWNIEKEPMPESPGDGPEGKEVILIVHGDHPFTDAYARGAQLAADAYGMELTVMSPNWDLNVQNQLIDQAINARPDMIALLALDAKSAIQQYRKIYDAGIPLVATNMLADNEAMKYCIGWSGPDDWGQFRMLAQEFAEEMNYEGGYCCVQHLPGGSPYYARCSGPISELVQIAPNMKLLDKQAPGFDASKVTQLVADWITKYGEELKGIVVSDDSAQLVGVIDACKKAGRSDIVIVAAGNSKVGMAAVEAGETHALTYQSSEGDGAAVIKLAADYFYGNEVKPITYIAKHIITKEDVEQYMPAQW